MKFLVVGLGSMGRRRARLLQSMGDYQVVGVDLDEERRLQAEEELGISTYGAISEAVARVKPQAAVVSTPPLSHASIVDECLESGLHVFTELNLVDDGYERNMAKAKEEELVWFPSATFVYRHEIEALQEMVGEDPRGAWTYHVGQYLPDWHPWESYKSFFVADGRTSGIRELLAVELPWLVRTFGPIDEIYHVSQKISNLEVSYNDAIVVAVKHREGSIGMLLIDVVCRKAVRDFSFTNEDCYVTWDGSPNGLRKLDLESQEMKAVDVYGRSGAIQLDDYARFIVEDAYKSELTAFVDAIGGSPSAKWTLEEDAEVISVINRLGV